MSTNEIGSTGESDLLTLIAQMSPSLDAQIWAFVSVDEVSSEYVAEHALATFRETEGTTLISRGKEPRSLMSPVSPWRASRSIFTRA